MSFFNFFKKILLLSFLLSQGCLSPFSKSRLLVRQAGLDSCSRINIVAQNMCYTVVFGGNFLLFLFT